MGYIRELRLWNMIGIGKRAGCYGSKELFEFGELVLGGNELTDFANGLAVDEVL